MNTNQKSNCSQCVTFPDYWFANLFITVTGLSGLIILFAGIHGKNNVEQIGLGIVVITIVVSLMTPIYFHRLRWKFLDQYGILHTHSRCPKKAPIELQERWFGSAFEDYPQAVAFGIRVTKGFHISEIATAKALSSYTEHWSIVDRHTNDEIVTIEHENGEVLGLPVELLVPIFIARQTVTERLDAADKQYHLLSRGLSVAIEAISKSRDTMGRSRHAERIRLYLESLSTFIDSEPVDPESEKDFSDKQLYWEMWNATEEQIKKRAAAQ